MVRERQGLQTSSSHAIARGYPSIDLEFWAELGTGTMTADRTIADRISDVLRLLTRDGATSLPADTAGPAEFTRFEEAVRRVTESVEHWREGRSLVRFVQESARDRIAAVGHEVELAVKVEALYRGGPDLPDRTVRFAVDGLVVGEARTDEHGLAHLGYVPTAPGVHRVTYEVLSDKGRVLRPLESGEHAVLQVVTDAPVAAVDAGLLFSSTAVGLEPLRGLVERGWQLCYLDFHNEDRTSEIHATVERERLPSGAALVHPAEDVGFETFQVDFAPVFAASMLRRTRALGVPVVMAVAEAGRADAFSRVDGLTVLTHEVLQRYLEEGSPLEELADEARDFVKARDGVEAGDRFRRALDLMTGSKVRPGNRVHAELDNRKAREAVFDALEKAERSIHAQFYMVNAGRFAEHFAVRLVGRARAGVKVRLVVDALYSGQEVLGLQNPVVKALQGEPNIEILASDPITFAEGVDALRLKQRDHRKLVIVDGRRAFVSGRNAGDEYYESFDEVPILDSTLHERIPWLDAHLEISGPLVADLQRVFLENWRRNRGSEVSEDDAVFPVPVVAGSSWARVIHHDGISDANALLSYEAIIHGARDHVYVINDFPVLATLSAVILRAVARGVRVEFLTGCAMARRMDGTFFKGPLHRELFEYMTKRRFEPLIRGGVRVYEYQVSERPTIVARGGVVRPYVHAKVVAADGEIVSVGSANLDATAAYWEREVNVVVEDRAVAREVEAQIASLIGTSVPLDLESEYWKREAARRAITDTFWPDVMYS